MAKSWIEKHLPATEVRSFKELLPNDPLRITAANGTDVPFEGWAEVLVEIRSEKEGQVAIHVPMLVSQSCVNGLLLGFNVIDELILECLEKSGSVSLSDLLAEALKLHRDTAETIVSVVNETPTCQQTRNEMIRLGKRRLTVPSGQICQVKCHIRDWSEEGTMLFEPALKRDVPNGLDLFPALINVPPGASKTVKIKHDIFLPPRTALGCIEGIIDSRPMDFGPPYQQPGQSSTDTYTCTMQGSQASHSSARANSIPETYTSKKWHPPVNLEHLDQQQQEVVRQMLFEESDVFARGEGDVGCIPNLHLKINVTDNNPVQKCYSSIPKPLYQEVKDYVKNLLDRGWSRKSVSSYSSPVVCAHKKDHSLQLCVDFRGLNKKNKTVADRHPLPLIQDLLGNLGAK